MGMMIRTTNDGLYATNGTSTSEPSQLFGGMANVMAAAKAFVAPVAAVILGEPIICCEASREMIPLV
jgi:hypothetical protein